MILTGLKSRKPTAMEIAITTTMKLWLVAIGIKTNAVSRHFVSIDFQYQVFSISVVIIILTLKLGRDGLYCSEECTKSGCWGAGANQCLECKHVKFNGTCLRSCQSQPNMYTMPDRVTCGQCHPECKRSCSGPDATDCLECVHVRDDRLCVAECPKTKYAKNGVCVNCHETCAGCTGPNNTIGENGCITCDKAIIIDNQVEKCLRKDEDCPGKNRRNICKVNEQKKQFANLSNW